MREMKRKLPRRLTLADRIRAFVFAFPGYTATQIAHKVKGRPGSVSSFLHKAWRDKTMHRTLGKGPRGGATWS